MLILFCRNLSVPVIRTVGSPFHRQSTLRRTCTVYFIYCNFFKKHARTTATQRMRISPRPGYQRAAVTGAQYCA